MKKFFEKFLVTDKTPTIECDTLNWFMGNEDYEKRFKKIDVICDDLVAVLYEIEEYCRDNFIIAKNYQIIMLGEDYIKWFDEKKYEVENLTTRKEYATSLTNEKIQELWETQGGTKNIISLFYPFIVFQLEQFKQDTSFALSKETIEVLTKKLSNVYHKNEKDIAVLKYIVSGIVAEESNIHIEQLIINKLEDNKNIIYGKLDTQRMNKQVNMEMLNLCVGIRTFCNTCVFDKNWRESLEEYKIFLEELPADDICEILMNEFTKEEYAKDLAVLPIANILMFGDELLDYKEMYLKLLGKELKKSNIQLRMIENND